MKPKTLKRINSHDAHQCEVSKARQCRCRCEGALHGKSHAKLVAFEDKLVKQGDDITSLKLKRFINKNQN